VPLTAPAAVLGDNDRERHHREQRQHINDHGADGGGRYPGTVCRVGKGLG
jgi:hypothetical protein